MAKKARAPRKPVPRGPLTREAISAAALQLIDQEGLDGLSMRRLGTELGVEAMALYHHFRNKGELLDGVMDRMLDEIEWTERGSLPPLIRLRKMFESYRQLAVKHPHAFILLAYRRFNTEHSFALYERVLDAMADLGLDATHSARYFRMFGYYMNGAGMAEIASRATAPDATPVQLEDFTSGDRFPRVAAVVPHLRLSKLDEIYNFGFEMILRDMERTAKELSRKKKDGR
jgi:AcrR family transcriptional regulator